jgi:hypothetical protein
MGSLNGFWVLLHPRLQRTAVTLYRARKHLVGLGTTMLTGNRDTFAELTDSMAKLWQVCNCVTQGMCGRVGVS